MKKLMVLALAMALVMIPALSQATEASVVSETEVPALTGESAESADEKLADAGLSAKAEEAMGDAPEAEEATAEATVDAGALTEAQALETAEGAAKLYELIARSFDLGIFSFAEEPDAQTAWAITYEALETGAVDGFTDGRVSAADVKAAYHEIFAYGDLPEMPEGFTLLAPDGDGYVPTSDGPESTFIPSVLGVTVEGDEIYADVVVMEKGWDTPEDIAALMSVTIVPDAAAPFGAKLAGVIPKTSGIEVSGATATAQLEAYKKITYGAENSLDGDLTTCWAYSEAENPGSEITLFCDTPQTVSGIRLTPAYAKSAKLAEANNRIRSIRVALSDGASYDFTLEEDLQESAFDSYASFAFDRVHEVTSVTVTVTGVYAGGKYTDTCISEIHLF